MLDAVHTVAIHRHSSKRQFSFSSSRYRNIIEFETFTSKERTVNNKDSREVLE